MVVTRNHDYNGVQRAPKRKRLMQVWARAPDPNMPPKEGVCLFLSVLPGELRNQIWDLVLSQPDGLFHRVEDGKYRLCISVRRKGNKRRKLAGWCEANQLQYVNKQIRAETKGFGVRLNTIHFVTPASSTNHPSSLATGLTFLKELELKHFQHLRTITIRRKDKVNRMHSSNYFGFGGIQAQLLDICRVNPQMTVEWACPNWELRHRFCNFIRRGVVLSLAYRSSGRITEDNEDSSDIDPAAVISDSIHTTVNNPIIRNSSTTNLVINNPEVTADSFIRLFPLGMSAAEDLAEYNRDVEFWRRGVGKAIILNVPNFKIFPYNVINSREAYVKKVEVAARGCGPHKPPTVSQETWKTQALNWYNDGI